MRSIPTPRQPVRMMPPSGAKPMPMPPATPKPKAVARRAVTPAIRQTFRDTYGAGWKKNADLASQFTTQRRAAVKAAMPAKAKKTKKAK